MPTKLLHPLLFFIARVSDSALARCVEYLVAENQTLRGKLPKQIRTTPQERARLVELGQRVGPDLKNSISSSATQRSCLGNERPKGIARRLTLWAVHANRTNCAP